MRTHALDLEQRIARPLTDVFAFFSQARNLERITPPWLRFNLVGEGPGQLSEGSLIDYRLRVHGVPLRWTSLIEVWEPGTAFVDRQLRGPYRLWRHRHEFVATGRDTIVRDHVRYALPLGGIGELAHMLLIRRDLERIFAFRRRSVERLLA
jgi:ligand-binding SRPBCC domain-containing protein